MSISLGVRGIAQSQVKAVFRVRISVMVGTNLLVTGRPSNSATRRSNDPLALGAMHTNTASTFSVLTTSVRAGSGTQDLDSCNDTSEFARIVIQKTYDPGRGV